jgi:hypothetical protein
MKRLALAFAAFLALGAAAHAAGFITPAEQRHVPFSGVLPGCDDPGVLSTITGRFGQTESGYWSSPLEINGYDRIREIGFRANGVAYIPRRYCIARATLNDSRTRLVVYQVQEDLGFAPACSALRPYVTRFLGEKALSERY